MPEEFKIIDTQEAFDEAIKGYLKPDEALKLDEKIKSYETEIADLKAKNQAHEINAMKSKIAIEKGIPNEIADRLSGETEYEIRKDAEKFSSYFGGKNARETPMFSTEKSSTDSIKSAFSALIHELNN